jgi:hypothetical protein
MDHVDHDGPQWTAVDQLLRLADSRYSHTKTLVALNRIQELL